MTEAVGYLMEETYRPEWLRDGVMESTLNGVIDMKPEIVELGKEIAGADRFYLVTESPATSRYKSTLAAWRIP